MKLLQAQRTQSKLKLGLQGPSGSGKTMSALLVAFGLCNDWSRVAVVDSESYSAGLYAHLGGFNVLNLVHPFTPERYIEAIRHCEKENIAVVIIDSITHEWENLLDYHASLPGNSFTNWSKVTPRHNAFVQTILQSPVHIICTVRTKQDYVLSERDGKSVPEKVGLKPIQRDGLDYDLTLAFNLDMNNTATASKDRTGMFLGQPGQKLGIDTGRQILSWCNAGSEITVDQVSLRIGACTSIADLLELYKQFPQFKMNLQREFEARKRELIISPQLKTELLTQKTTQNGVHFGNA